MGSDFWDAFTDGAAAAIDTMGEGVSIGAREMRAVVQPVEVDPQTAPGGINPGVTHLFQVSLADGASVADGDKVESRLLRGAVIRKEHFGGGWMIHAGPANRWDGEI